MASIVVSGDTSGAVTITAPAIAGTTTLTLPTTSGTILTTGGGAAGSFTTLTSTGASSFATSSGNVGIGTNSPGAKLDVSESNAGGTVSLRVLNTSTSANSSSQQFNYVNGASAGDPYTTWTVGGVSAWSAGLRNSDSDKWYLSPSSSLATTPSLVVDTSGNVGIGTSSPSSFGKFVVGDGSKNARLLSSDAEIMSQLYGAVTKGHVRMTYPAVADWDILAGSSGQLAFKYNDTERMRIDTSGNVLVGCTSVPSGSSGGTAFAPAGAYGVIRLLFSSNNTATVAMLAFDNPNGNVGSIGTSGSNAYYATTSDYRLKENIAPMTGALAKIAQLKPCTYTWKADGSAGQGFIAHELQAVVPDAVTGEKDAVDKDGKIKPQGIDTSYLVATLTAAIQEQQQIINDLKARIETLEGAK